MKSRIKGKHHFTRMRESIHDTRYTIHDTRAFTLIELVVVTGIIIIITSIVLVNNNKYGGSVLLQNLAYDIALSIRQAQVYGISVRNAGGTTGFSTGYGMHFDTDDRIHYELFSDIVPSNGNGLFDDASENVAPSPYVIGRGYYIAKLCAPAGADAASCTPVSKLDILFKRPEPDACISAGGTSAIVNGSCSGGKTDARIVVESPQGSILSIVVTATGQISVSPQVTTQ